MSRKFLFIATIFAAIFLVGCSSKEQRVPLEDVGMVGIVAFDYIDENTMQLSIAIPQYSSHAQKNTEVFSVTTELASKGIIDIEALSDKKITFSQLRVVLIDEKFARIGDLQRTIRHLYRNPAAADKVLIAIVKGVSAKELIEADYPDKPNINFYLNDILKPTINTAFNPNTNIHDFVYTGTNPVIDPIIPVIERKDQKIEISSVALFKNNKMLETISAEDAYIIQNLQKKHKIAPLSITLNQGDGTERLVFNIVKSKVNIKSNKNIDSPKLTISLVINGALIEYKGKRNSSLYTSEGLSKIENDIDKQIKNNIDQFLDKLKEYQVDPIGLSEYFRMYYNGKWTKEMTEDITSKLQIDVQVKTSIISTGTLD
ncbi:Ger(x)C family spore germination protein [Solibacillus sp. CAU 1738]|uniref:Ger(x)C family spore germination protein n=1 Tax=Solibacillus sp. CAU 1738 TaxID=3140363 RepID=UPI003261A002